MAKKRTKSHRQSLKVKYMVDTKAKAHKKKLAKLAKNAPHLQKKSTKDPGVPNLFPFKEDLCRQMLKKKEQVDDEVEAQRQKRRSEADKRKAMIAKATAMQIEEFESERNAGKANNEVRGRAWYFKELRQVVETADVILIVLDARDPMGCRSLDLEEKIVSGQLSSASPIAKRIIFILNKIDLVPRNVAQQWLTYLRRSFPTIAFKASTQKQRSNLTFGKGKAESANDGQVSQSGSLGADALIQLLKNYSRNLNMKTSLSVGLIGYPNTGKSSIINSLKRSRAVNTGSMPGLTKVVQEVHLDGKIKLLDSPGVIFSDSDDALLRNAVKIETISDPVGAVATLLTRFPGDELMAFYEIARFADANEFLFRVAHKRGKLKKGGVPDIEQAAVAVLRDWNEGRIPFYVAPPVVVDDPIQSDAPRIVDAWADELDLDAILDQNVCDDEVMFAPMIDAPMPASVMAAAAPIRYQSIAASAPSTSGGVPVHAAGEPAIDDELNPRTNLLHKKQAKQQKKKKNRAMKQQVDTEMHDSDEAFDFNE